MRAQPKKVGVLGGDTAQKRGALGARTSKYMWVLGAGTDTKRVVRFTYIRFQGHYRCVAKPSCVA